MIDRIQLVECPRDAMQGWLPLIPTAKKIEYINQLLQVGFDIIDFGSFVSPKAIPQMADTKEVIKNLKLQNSRSELLAIVANLRGAREATDYDTIRYLGFPFSISPTFQFRNTNSTMEESLQRLEGIQELCLQSGKQVVVYLSMAFGNPYGDPYNSDILLQWADEMITRGIQIVSLADTVGVADSEQITVALKALVPHYPETIFGVHLHSTPHNWEEKLDAAIDAGCHRIDGALRGIGGCPMAGNELVGNMNTEWIIAYLKENNQIHSLNEEALEKSLHLASQIFT